MYQEQVGWGTRLSAHLEHFEDFPVSCFRSSLWSWDKVFCLDLTTGSIWEKWFLVFLVLSGVGGLLEEELVEGDATLEGKQSLVSTPRISSQVPFFDLHVLIFKRYPIKSNRRSSNHQHVSALYWLIISASKSSQRSCEQASHICFGPICNALKTCDGETSFKCCQSPGASFQFFTVWETAFTRVQNPSPSTDWDQLYFIITVVVNITIHHRPEAHSRRRAMEAVVSWNVAAFYELIIRGIYAYIYQASREASLGSQF